MPGYPVKEILVLSAFSSYMAVGYLRGKYIQPGFIISFIISFLTYTFTWAFWEVLLYPNFFSPLRHFPSPKEKSWWNGHFSLIASQPEGTPMLKWSRTVPNDGIIRYFVSFNSERLFITSPNALREVLTTRSYDFIKPHQFAEALRRLVGVGLLLAEGEEHKRQRRNLMPAFSYRHIKDLYPLFWEKSIEVVEAITEHIQAGGLNYDELPEYQKEVTQTTKISETEALIEVSDWAGRSTLDIIGIAGLGRDFNITRNPNSSMNENYRIVFKPNRQAQILGLLGYFLPVWFIKRIPIKRNGEIQEATKVIRETCRETIQIKVKKLEQGKLNDVDILSIALKSGGFSEENLIDQMFTFLTAGHETTCNAMTWAIYSLCANPSCQTRLRAEIRANLPPLNSSKSITSSQIDSLNYLNAVCNEVLRCFPPIAFSIRDAVKDTSILGHRIPKGTRIYVSPWATNKSEELWGPDANVFHPERWLPSETNPHPANGGASSNYSFLSFLHGPRSCIGQSFSKGEFACLLAAWIGRFEFFLNDEREMIEDNLQIMGGITPKPGLGLFVKARIIDGW